MKHLSTILLVCLMGFMSKADTFDYLNFVNSSGTTQVTTDGLKITFADGNLVASAGDKTTTIALSTLSEMYFTDTALQTWRKGDVNHDGFVDLTDLNLVINAMLDGVFYTDYDINGDSEIDVSDISYIINIIIS